MRSLFRESMETSTAGGRWGRPSAWGRCTAPGTRAAAITTRSHTPSPFPCFCCPSPLAPFVPAHSSLLSRVILSPLVHFVTSDTLPTFFSDGTRCPVGRAVCTRAFGEMPFDTIAHTTPPFYSSEAWSLELTSCYHAALTAIDTLRAQHEPNTHLKKHEKRELISDIWGKRGATYGEKANTHLRIASPLLGAGARGAPLDQAAGHAA